MPHLFIPYFKILKYILGISAFYHDSAAVLLCDGEIIFAIQEERFSRIKHDASFPRNSILYILNKINISILDIDEIIFYDKPFLKFERLLETYLANIPSGFNSFKVAMPIWLREKLFLKIMLKKEFKKIDKNFDSTKLNFSEHHFSHAASAFYPSPFENAVILTLDGVGEWATTTAAASSQARWSPTSPSRPSAPSAAPSRSRPSGSALLAGDGRSCLLWHRLTSLAMARPTQSDYL